MSENTRIDRVGTYDRSFGMVDIINSVDKIGSFGGVCAEITWLTRIDVVGRKQ